MIYLTAIDRPMQQAWRKYSAGLKDVMVFDGGILECNAEAVVSPANSYGFMDGGLDLLYTQTFGKGLESAVKAKIIADYGGMMPVGNAFAIETGHPIADWLIVAPTMMAPRVLPIDSNVPYLAARAILRVAQSLSITTLAFPGLGTGVGGFSHDRSAFQVCRAIQEMQLGWPIPESWQAAKRHESMIRGLI